MNATITPAGLFPVNAGWLLGFVVLIPDKAITAEQAWERAAGTTGLSRWFPCHVSGDFTVGGALRFTFEGPSKEEDLVMEGSLLRAASPDGFSLSWGEDVVSLAIDEREVGLVLRFSTVIDELGRAARDAAGWHVCLATLVQQLGAAVPGQDTQWQGLFDGYAESFGPDAATEGPLK